DGAQAARQGARVVRGGRRQAPSGGRWQSVVCIASGPSLNKEDCEQVRRWREVAAEAGEARGVVVANTTFRLCPWADALYAMDRAWWDVHLAEVKATFRGELLSRRNSLGIRDARLPIGTSNSGAGAIALAA